MKVRLAEPAANDIRRITDLIALTDPDRAGEVTGQLKSAVKAIGLAPLQCPPVTTKPPLRKESVTPWLLLFAVRGGEVLILRVAHERSDWVSLV